MCLHVSTYSWHMWGLLLEELYRGVCLADGVCSLHGEVCLMCVGMCLSILGTCGLHYLGSSLIYFGHFSCMDPSIKKTKGALANK